MGAAASHWGLIRGKGHEGQATTSCSTSVFAPRHSRKDPSSEHQCTRGNKPPFHVKPETGIGRSRLVYARLGERECSESTPESWLR